MSRPDPSPPPEPASPANARIGMILFTVYTAFYLGFMLLSAFAPGLMAEPFLAGLNAAVLYGFALIIVALVLALFYSWVCRDAGDSDGKESNS